jgi:hypothetical protein
MLHIILLNRNLIYESISPIYCYGVPVIYITHLTTENIKLSKVLGLEQNYRRIYT